MEQTNVKPHTTIDTVEKTVTESSTSEEGGRKSSSSLCSSSSTVSNVELNKKAMSIMNEDGSEEAVKYMFNPTGKRQLTYAEMRSMFG